MIKNSFSKVFLGLIIVFFGLVLLFNSLGIFNLHFDFWIFWPILIIFLGLAILSKNNIISDIVSFSAILLAFAMILFIVFSPAKPTTQTSSLNIAKDANANSLEIELEAGMGEINISGGAGEQYAIQGSSSSFLNFNASSSTSNNVQKIVIKAEKPKGSFSSEPNNVLTIMINENLPVSLKINGGASVIKMDLKTVELTNLELNAAASTVDLTLGDFNSEVAINSGFSTINIKASQDSGVKLSAEQGFSSFNISGLDKTEGNTYTSSNYSSADKKIDINLAIGFASANFSFYKEEKTQVDLYYYNEKQDEEVTCAGEFVLPVKRDIVLGGNKYVSVMNSLLQGNLTQAEKDEGFTTEFSNPDFKLLKAEIDDQGILNLEFNEVPGFTSGGSCRVSILANEVIKTAKQFPEVKQVNILPETLFQP